MTTPLTLSTDRRDDGRVAVVAIGEIDLSNVGSFTRALDDAIAGVGSDERVTVDLSAVDYVDSGAINALFTFADHIQVIVKPLLVPVLTISGFTELAHVEASPPAEDR